jgi:hypothetical protein
VYPDSFVRDRDGVEIVPRTAEASSNMLLPELLGPVFGGLSTRTNLARASQIRLSRLVGRDPRALVELRMPAWRTTVDDKLLEKEDRGLCVDHYRQPSMNWSLDSCSRARLSAGGRLKADDESYPTLAQSVLFDHLARLRALINDGATDFGGFKGP